MKNYNKNFEKKIHIYIYIYIKEVIIYIMKLFH